MGKNRKMKPDSGGNQHSPATVFVTNLPYTFSNSQLEETFSDVGPIRRCFMVTQKGSTEHRGFAYVQFAVTEDANRAIELKNGSSIGGRTIGVKQAMHRAPLEKRRPKGNEVVPSDDIKGNDDHNDIDGDIIKTEDGKDDSLIVSDEVVRTKDDKDDISAPIVKHKKARDSQKKGKIDRPKKEVIPLKIEHVEGALPALVVKHMQTPDSKEKGKVDKPKKVVTHVKTEHVEGISSEKQRVARTVVIGGLNNKDMADDVHHLAKECGSVLSITYPLPNEEILHHGLSQDGCRLGASSIVYDSVKSARACVTKIHHKVFRGGTVWARQLGGEGSKVQKWKLIIRNLPFKADVDEIKKMFSGAGFVWDVFIPKNPDSGLAKGFAFVKFTCKQDAENAIQKFNGKSFGKRTIAVDWAIPKKIYTAGSQVAVEDGQKDSGDEDSDSDLDGDHVELDKSTHHSNKDADMSDSPELVDEEMNFDEEADLARKVLNNFLATSGPATSVNDDSIPVQKKQDNETVIEHKKVSVGHIKVLKPESLTKPEKTTVKPVETEEELERTLFISNLPFDITNDEVKQRFTTFGEIQSYFPVLHPVTKRPRGTGFLKFKALEAADAAFEAATSVAGLGIILKGRQLKLLKALNKNAAHEKEVEKMKKEEIDHRNLYLAKEGMILEGTPAAEGVSDSDLSKRRSLEKKKETKLQSPNFHVSRTRLIMYNVPKSMNDKQLKRLCLAAVKSRATKQNPMIRQIKLLQDSDKGKELSKNHSRGVAFIEFTEHQHALVALRVLNNNPETFTAEHRPIVEFALDNVQTLRQRNEKIEAQRQEYGNNSEKPEKKIAFRKPVDRPIDDSRKRKTQSAFPENKSDDKPAETRITGGKPAKKPFEVQQEGNRFKVLPNKKRSRDEKESKNDDSGSTKRRRNKDPLGKDTADKLDLLIEQYRSKFAGNRTKKTEGENQGPRRLGRWFQS